MELALITCKIMAKIGFHAYTVIITYKTMVKNRSLCIHYCYILWYILNNSTFVIICKMMIMNALMLNNRIIENN